MPYLDKLLLSSLAFFSLFKFIVACFKVYLKVKSHFYLLLLYEYLFSLEGSHLITIDKYSE